MKPITILSRKITLLLAPVSFLMLASCGSYQYSGYGEDGIYGDMNRGNERQVRYSQQEATQETNGNYYQNLFSEEAALYGDVLAEGAVFTDVESYSSLGNVQAGQGQVTGYQGGNAPWGNDPDSYSINFYNNGFYGGFMDPFWGGGMFGFDPFWGPGMWGPGMWGGGMWGPGMWGPGLGWGGFYGPRFGGMWGNPWGFGYGLNFGFGIHPFLYGAGGWHNPYLFHGGNFGYNRNDVAYNRGRRNTATNFNNSRAANLRNATNLDSRGRSSSYSRSIRTLRNSNDDYGITRRRVSRDYNSSRMNSESPYRSSRSINNSTRRNDVYSRQSTMGRNSGAVRSSTSTPRSSGAVRSSGNMGRSSGGAVRSSGGSGSRGRGN